MKRLFLVLLSLLCICRSLLANTETLFLTWFEDPTTTMVAQWLQRGAMGERVGGMETETHNIPQLNGITVDGDISDWGAKGFEVNMLHGYQRLTDLTDFYATFRLGWSADGVYFITEVTDDEFIEDSQNKRPWKFDSIELFLGEEVGGKERFQLVVSPGLSEAVSEPQYLLNDRRKEKEETPFKFKYAIKPSDTGYVAEFFFPWNNFKKGFKQGESLALQVIYHDFDSGERYPNTYSWFQYRNTWSNSYSKKKLILGEEPSKPYDTIVLPVIFYDLNMQLQIWTLKDLVGETVQIKTTDKAIGECVFEEDTLFPKAVFDMPSLEEGYYWGTMFVESSKTLLGQANWPNRLQYKRPEPANVEYGESENALDNKLKTTVLPFPGSPYSVERALFSDLKPGTDYYFKIEGSDETFKFKTAPATLAEPLVLVEGGGIGNNIEKVTQMHQTAAAQAPLFALIGGNMAHCNGVNNYAWYQYLKLWNQHMRTPEGYLIPQLACIGNKETRGGFDKKRRDAPYFYALFDGLFTEAGYGKITFGDYLALFLLDSGHSTPIDGEQAAWLSTALPKAASVLNRFVAYHIPAYPGHRKMDNRNRPLIREHWVPLFEEHGVDVAFEHNDNVYKRTYPLLGGKRSDAAEGVLYLGDGAWGQTARKARTPEERDYIERSASSRNIIKVTLDEQKTTLDALNEKGALLDSVEIEK